MPFAMRWTISRVPPTPRLPMPTSSGGVVAAAEVGATHGEICGTLRRELGFGHPLTAV
jgi:hypothetical protein